MDKPELSSYSKAGMYEASCMGPGPRERTSEGDGRRPAGSQCQQVVCGGKSQLSDLNSPYTDQAERPKEVEKEAGKAGMYEASCMGPGPRERTSEGDGRRPAGSQCQQVVCGGKSQLSDLNSPYTDQAERPKEVEKEAGEFAGVVTQKVFQQKGEDCEECKKMKEKIRGLEARIHALLSKAMSMHKHSENMNDCWRLSAVLQRYDMLRLHEWEKFRSSEVPILTYSNGRKIIQELFDACEMDLQCRMNNIFGVLEIPASNDTTIDSKHGMTQQMRDILKYAYSQNHLKFYSSVLTGGDQRNHTQRRFIMECCQVYCLLRLQDSPIKVEWCLEERSEKYLEHVDKKSLEHWRKRVGLLWPILKSGEQVIRKGVIYDKK
ncbi:uncharacterized protein LOC112983489 [Dromaius novaehollandiae]|uniref:uncharacterized protein LOC112983489 n=1 Tax=Dromaius novaehollandiae TaxID=8790 RepID=UPI00311E0935